MDGFVSVERQRLRLEDNVAALRKSLQHWRTWEAEYEGLKEEISGLGKKPAKTKLVILGGHIIAHCVALRSSMAN